MTPEFPTTYTRLLVRELQLDDDGVVALIEGTDVRPEDVFRLDTRVSLTDSIRIVLNALAISNNPALGLQVGAHMPHMAHGPLGVALSAAPTLRHSMEVVEQYQRMHIPVIHVAHRQQGGDLFIELENRIPLDGVGLFLLEALLASMDQVLEGAVAGFDDPGEMQLGYAAPGHADQYAFWLKRPVSFGHSRTTIRLPAGCAATPNPFANPEIYAHAVMQCARAQAELESLDSWRARVTRLIQQHPGQLWTAEEVAAAFDVSVRSLGRSLSAEGCTYQQLLDDELLRQAEVHLQSPGHTVASVASALGYNNASAFRRAFKRWTGMTPQDWQGARGR